MTLIIVCLMIVAFLLIATESLTKTNRAAVAIFAGTLGWVLYICYGTDFVMSQHPADFSNFLDGKQSTSVTVKEYIASNIFLKYVGTASEIVLFLLATMTIVEILNNNGCFDFLKQMLRTRKSKRMLWTLAGITFVLSANLDNLTSTTMMLTMMHGVVPNRVQRMVYGAVIVLAANWGGLLTVIGEPSQLLIWNRGAVTATNYSLSLLLPRMAGWLLPTWWLGRSLPEHVDTEWITMPYRGDDTNLNVWQRLVMLLVGIGGLWFIPTFHNITKLSPFLGALCVLGLLWIVNEAFNRKLMSVDKMVQDRVPRVLRYGTSQMMLFVMGIMLLLGVVKETGALSSFALWWDMHVQNVWLSGAAAAALSSVLDNFVTAAGCFTLYPVMTDAAAPFSELFTQNGLFWKVISFSVVAGGNVLAAGSLSGMALMKLEHVHIGWYFRNVGVKALAGGALGLAILWITETFLK